MTAARWVAGPSGSSPRRSPGSWPRRSSASRSAWRSCPSPSLGIPFENSLLGQILSTAGGYPYATVNAYNPWALVSLDGSGLASAGTWIRDVLDPARPTDPFLAPLGIPAVLIGGALIGVAIIGLMVVLWRRHDDRRALLVALTVMAIAFFVIPTRVHERYLYPFFALGAILLVLRPRWAVVYAILAAANFANLYGILTLPFYDNPGLAPMLDAFGGLGHAARGGDPLAGGRLGRRPRPRRRPGRGRGLPGPAGGRGDRPRARRRTDRRRSTTRRIRPRLAGATRRERGHPPSTERRDRRRASRRRPPDAARGAWRRRPSPCRRLGRHAGRRSGSHRAIRARRPGRAAALPLRPHRLARPRGRRAPRPPRPLVPAGPGRGGALPADVPSRRADADALRRGLPRPDGDRVPPGLALRRARTGSTSTPIPTSPSTRSPRGSTSSGTTGSSPRATSGRRSGTRRSSRAGTSRRSPSRGP